jgi:hypothetical protein
LVAIYALNLVDKACDCRNDSGFVLILESTDLMELRVLAYCVQCPHITVVAGLAMLLELNDVDNDAIERAMSFISSRTSTDVFLYLALDARDA